MAATICAGADARATSATDTAFNCLEGVRLLLDSVSVIVVATASAALMYFWAAESETGAESALFASLLNRDGTIEAASDNSCYLPVWGGGGVKQYSVSAPLQHTMPYLRTL